MCQSKKIIFYKEKVTFNAYHSKQSEMNITCVCETFISNENTILPDCDLLINH